MTYKCPRCDMPLEWGDEPDGCRDWLCPVDRSFWQAMELWTDPYDEESGHLTTPTGKTNVDQ